MNKLVFNVILIQAIFYANGYQPTIEHTNNPGIHYEEIYNLKLFSDKWNLMIIVNLDDYNIRSKAMYGALYDISVVCNLLLAKCSENTARGRELKSKLTATEKRINYFKKKILAETKQFSKEDFKLQFEINDVIDFKNFNFSKQKNSFNT